MKTVIEVTEAEKAKAQRKYNRLAKTILRKVSELRRIKKGRQATIDRLFTKLHEISWQGVHNGIFVNTTVRGLDFERGCDWMDV
jgi:hypothetical protein